MNWKKVKLGAVLVESKIEAKESIAEKRIRVLLNANGVVKRPIMSETDGATKYFERKAGQFIYGKQNLHKGAFGIIPSELDGYTSSSDLPAFNVNIKYCVPEWINYFLIQGDFYLKLVEIAKGAATKRIQPDDLLKVEIPLPDLETQKRIIENFQSIEEKSNALSTETKTQTQLLTQLRQSILQDAIQGKLTEAWRAENNCSPDKSGGNSNGGNSNENNSNQGNSNENNSQKLNRNEASAHSQNDSQTGKQLLERIKAEKLNSPAFKGRAKEKTLPPITKEEIPFELPVGWVWCRLGEITNYGLSKKAEPKNLNSDTWVLDLEDIEKESSKIIQEIHFADRNSSSTKSIFKKGDVLYSKLRPYLDKVVVAHKDGVCTTEILPLEMFCNVNSNYFMYALKRKDFLNYVATKVGGMKMPRLGTEEGRNAIFPLPPLSEQQAIVEKVEALLAKCDELSQEIETLNHHGKTLMKAIFNETFETKTVPVK